MRENGLIQGRLEGNIRSELEVIRKNISKLSGIKGSVSFEGTKGLKKKKKIRRQEDLVSIKPRARKSQAGDARQLAAVCSACHKAADHKRGAAHNKHIFSTIWKKSFFFPHSSPFFRASRRNNFIFGEAAQESKHYTSDGDIFFCLK